jgi:hypothetical protein
MPRGLTPEQATAAIDSFSKSMPQIEKAALDAAVKVVTPAAKGNLARQPVPNTSSMIEQRSGTGDPGITIRYSTYPWAAGAEAGSKRFRQFRSYRGFGDRGYIVGQAIRDTGQVSAEAARRFTETALGKELS